MKLRNCRSCGRHFMPTGRCQPWCSESCRFWSKVGKRNSEKCWEWKGQRSLRGYGRFDGTTAHRAAYRLTHGAIPEGLYVLHHCDNPPCCNPVHLYAGTPQDNMDDKYLRGRGRFVEPYNRARGERNGLATLTDKKVRKAREWHSRGMPYQEIADRLVVGYQAIWFAVHRRTWRHVK